MNPNYIVMPSNQESKLSWIFFTCLSMAIAAFAIFEGRNFIFGPAVMEAGDFAANAIVMVDARSMTDIYGNYSRWGFNHPGPFFFYWYVLFELIFRDALQIVSSAHQAHVLGGIALQSTVLAGSISLLSSVTKRTYALPLIAIVASVILMHAGNAISSIWMPHVLLAPYALLLISSALVAGGRERLLPIAVLMTCILCHGHVAQPLMSFPLLTAAIIGLVITRRKVGLSWIEILASFRTQIAVSLGIFALFLLPIIIDATRCPDCNIERIVHYLHENHGPTPNWRQAVNSIASFFVFEHKPESISETPRIPWLTKSTWVMLIAVITSYTLISVIFRQKKTDEAAHLLRLARYSVLALVLSCVWAHRITGPLYEFNSYFVYAIYFVLVATAIASLTLLLPKASGQPIPVALALVLLAILVSYGPSLPVFSATNVALDETSQNSAYTGRTALINQNTVREWPPTTALAAWAYRNGNTFMVPSDWRYVFGWKHGFDLMRARKAGDRLDIWEPGKAVSAYDEHRFSPSEYCRITPTSPLPPRETTVPLYDARKSCSITAYGLGENTPDPYVWGVAGGLFLQMRAQQVNVDATLSIRALPYLGNGNISSQSANIIVNGEEVGSMVFTGDQTQNLTIPSAVWNSRPVATIELEFPNAISPKQIGVSSDTRTIGLGLRSVAVQFH